MPPSTSCLHPRLLNSLFQIFTSKADLKSRRAAIHSADRTDKSPFCNKFGPARGHPVRPARWCAWTGRVRFQSLSSPPADDILVNHGVVEVVAHDRLEKRCRKSGAGDTLLPGLLLKKNCGVVAKLNRQTPLRRAFGGKFGSASKAYSVLRTLHPQAIERAPDPVSNFGGPDSLSDETRNPRENLGRKYLCHFPLSDTSSTTMDEGAISGPLGRVAKHGRHKAIYRGFGFQAEEAVARQSPLGISRAGRLKVQRQRDQSWGHLGARWMRCGARACFPARRL